MVETFLKLFFKKGFRYYATHITQAYLYQYWGGLKAPLAISYIAYK